MKLLVTGATGFVGGALARKLREDGHEVHAVVRDPERAEDLPAIGVKLFTGDVTEKESMREAMTGVDGVYHVAGWYRVFERVNGEAESINVKGTRNLLELAIIAKPDANWDLARAHFTMAGRKPSATR